MTDRLRIDQADLTLGELADIEEAIGCSLGTAFDNSTAKAIAALVWVTKRRDDPGFVMADAFAYRMADLELIDPNEPVGEAGAGGNGTSPQGSPGSGVSTRSR